MKKAIFTLAFLVMAFGNAGFAQRDFNLKSDAKKNVLKHYGVRDESIVPKVANWEEASGDHYRTNYTYDENDYYLNEEFTEYNEGEGWMPLYQIFYTYDFAGNVVEALGMYAYGGGVLVEAVRVAYTYEGGELSEVLYQQNVGSGWENDMKEVYTYNDNVTTMLMWDWNGGNWSPSDLYTYTRNGNSIELVVQYMQGGAWQYNERTVTTLNFNEQIIEILAQSWTGTSWVNYELTTYNYEGDVFTSKTIMVWDGSQWADDTMFHYDYDSEGNATHGLCYRMANGEWVFDDGDIEMAFDYSKKSNSYYGIKVEVEYFDVTNLKENAATIGAEVFPVPAQGVINIKAADFASN